jgi:hypothetical protein
MPDKSVVMGVSDKVISSVALYRYGLFVFAFLAGTLLCKVSRVNRQHNICGDHESRLGRFNFNLQTQLKLANIAFWLFLFAEIIYLFPLIGEYSSTIQISMSSGFSALYYIVEDNPPLISSFANVFPYPLIVYSYIALNTDAHYVRTNKYRTRLLLMASVIIFHSIFAAKRMFLIYFVIIVSLSYFIKHKGVKQFLPKILMIGIATFGAIYFAELLRYGITISNRLATPLFSREVFLTTFNYLMNAYIYSDINNTMVILKEDSLYQIISTSSELFRIGITRLFSLEFLGYGTLAGWDSLFGTVNIFGLLWHDLGVWGYFVMFSIGYFSEFFYEKASSSVSGLNTSMMMYIIFVVGIISSMRFNFFGQTIFLLPTLFIFASRIEIKRPQIPRL